jgi:hypothetical protein
MKPISHFSSKITEWQLTDVWVIHALSSKIWATFRFDLPKQAEHETYP